MHPVRVNWQIKAILPVVFVLLAGLLLFTIATVSLGGRERHAVIMVAGAGAVIICGVLIARAGLPGSAPYGRATGESRINQRRRP